MIKKIIKAILKYPLIAINRIYTYYYYKNNEKKDEYAIDDMFEAEGRILVFAPHVDDETIGLGGTLLKHKKRDAEMVLVYATDGGGSTSEYSREKLVNERKKEGKKIRDAYGFQSVYFLDEPDGKLDSSNKELIEKIVKILDKEQPDIIYTPFLIDGHKDHVETTKSVVRALENYNKEVEDIYMYEVNLPIEPKLVNSISLLNEEVFREKEKFYDIFKSQWAMGFSAFTLLNKRKSLIVDYKYGAEVFVKVDLESLKKIEECLEKQGFIPEQFRQLSSEYNLLFAFRKNKELKDAYNNEIEKILNQALARR